MSISIKLILSIFISLISLQNIQAQNTDSIYIWQGFQHNWSYNHRVNRIGNFLDYKNKEIVYTAASGLGADSTYYTSGYTLITGSDIQHYQGKTTFDIQGKEGDTIVLSKEIKIDLNEDDQGKLFQIFLNGFDLLSKKKADKFELFQVEITPIHSALSTDFMSFRIDISLQANCSTLECQCFNQEVNYLLDIHYLVLANKKKEVAITNNKTVHKYNWDKKLEIEHKVIPSVIQGKEGFNNAVIGIQKIGIQFNKEHWIKEWSNFISNLSYNAENGKMNFDLDLFYKEWSSKMKKESAYPRHSRFSKRGKGDVTLEMKISLIQFNTGKINTIIRKGKMFWRGKNHSADSEAAVSRVKIN